MSKAVITWNLNDFEENKDFKRCIKSEDMAMLLWELKNNSHRVLNIINDDDTYQAVLEYINELFKEFNVDIDDLID